MGEGVNGKGRRGGRLTEGHRQTDHTSLIASRDEKENTIKFAYNSGFTS